MAVKFNLKSSSGSCGTQSTCLDKFGCPPGRCPDFLIRRHDTKPSIKVSVEDCGGPMDLQGLVIEVNMWALAKLKSKVSESDTYFSLADNIGFEQVMVGDIIVMDRVRSPERMLVTGFDEKNKLVRVQRAYHGTEASSWDKGSIVRIFRILNGPAESEMIFQDIQTVEGTIDKDVLVESYLVYEWQAEDTCLPGCYWLEFKVLKMIDVIWFLSGGNWKGETHMHSDGFFYTGLIHTESSVKISYDQIDDVFVLPDNQWTGEIHLNSDGNYFTGLVHDEGSVILNKNNSKTNVNTSYNEHGSVGLHDISFTPSFTDESLTPQQFGCILGEGVEWVRRFPINGEGFLIKIENSHTTEI